MKGILFKDYLIEQITKGTKTETRRIIKPEPKRISSEWQKADDIINTLKDDGKKGYSKIIMSGKYVGYQVPEQRYLLGETLYIKENHIRFNGSDKSVMIKHFDELDFDYYKSSKGMILQNSCKESTLEDHYNAGWKKRSKLLLPEWAARHFIRIESLRVERLQDITEEGCITEGIDFHSMDGGQSTMWFSPHDYDTPFGTAKEAFKYLIDSVNGEGTWDSNPFVFVYEFKLAKREPKIFKQPAKINVDAKWDKNNNNE